MARQPSLRLHVQAASMLQRLCSSMAWIQVSNLVQGTSVTPACSQDFLQDVFYKSLMEFMSIGVIYDTQLMYPSLCDAV